MSTTITTGRKVGAIPTPAGPVFVLLEKTYESNETPRNPSWSCVGVGRYAEAVKCIFELASSTPGGMLASPSGQLTPQGYIRSWLRELHNPKRVELNDRELRLSESSHPLFTGLVGHSKHDSLLSTLEAHGFHEMARELREEGKAMLTAQMQASSMDLLIDLFNNATLNRWRWFTDYQVTTGLATECQIRPKKASAPPRFTLPGKYKQKNSENILSKRDDGSLYEDRWEYALRGRFIARYGDLEIANPGHYMAALKALDDHFSSMPYVEDVRHQESLTSGLSALARQALL